MRDQAAKDSSIRSFAGGCHFLEGTVVRAGGFGNVKGGARGPGTRMGEHERLEEVARRAHITRLGKGINVARETRSQASSFKTRTLEGMVASRCDVKEQRSQMKYITL